MSSVELLVIYKPPKARYEPRSVAPDEPFHRVLWLNWMRSTLVPPKIIAPILPLPIGKASVTHWFAGASYHNNKEGLSALSLSLAETICPQHKQIAIRRQLPKHLVCLYFIVSNCINATTAGIRFTCCCPIVLVQQNTHITDRGLLYGIDFAYWFQLEITCIVDLAETNVVWNRVVHDIAELTAGIALCPVLTVVADIKVVLVDSTAQVVCGYGSIAETLTGLFLTHIHYQRRETFNRPCSLAITIKCHSGIGTYRLPFCSIDMT